MSKDTTELSAIVAHVAAHPTDEVRWLVLADWLDDRGDRRGVDIRRWWKVRPDLIRAWGSETTDAGRLKAAAAACAGVGGEWWRLCACLDWRLCRDRWPVPYDRITTWPEGWSSARHKTDVESAVGQIELAAFGLGDLRPVESVAMSAAESAVAAAARAEFVWSVRSAAWSAAESATPVAEWAELWARAADRATPVAEWAELSADSAAAAAAAKAARAVACAAAESARSAMAAADSAAAESAAARLYFRAAELLREGQSHDGG